MVDEIKIHYINLLNGAKVIEIKRILDLICFTFETTSNRKIHIHSQCFLRVFDGNNSLLICTQNLLDPSRNIKKKKFDWAKVGTTLFDDAVNDYQEQILSSKITSVLFNHNDLELRFSNQMRMNILITSTVYDDNQYSENYRIFDSDDHSKDLIL